tara:strand:- start:82 stop:351 length:270 start_codon:yes stop_codon:yes gene_type:complete
LVNPYDDKYIEDKIIRTFESFVHEDELIWHRDKKNRLVRVIKGSGWQFQYDNELPKSLDVGDSLYIEKDTYHRLIKGDGTLVLEIKEND